MVGEQATKGFTTTTDSVGPLILMAASAFQPFAAVPRTLTYAERGLPNEWEPRWEGDEIEGFGHLLAKVAEEVWAWTEEPIHDAATASAEIVVARSEGGARRTLNSKAC